MQLRGEAMELAVVQPASGGFPRHSHDEYVVSANVRGWERVRLDGAAFEVGTEEVTVYNPGQVQSCTASVPHGTAWSCVSLYVHPDAVAAWTGGHLVDAARPFVHAPQLRAALLAAVHTDLGTELDRELLLEQMTILFLALVDRTGTRRTPAPDPRDARIRMVMDRLRADLAMPARISDVAADVGLSREHLIRSFTRATGCPPYAWQLQARVAEGRRQLRLGHAVAEVAHRLGFADQAHLSKHFSAAYAITPGRYRTPSARPQAEPPTSSNVKI